MGIINMFKSLATLLLLGEIEAVRVLKKDAPPAYNSAKSYYDGTATYDQNPGSIIPKYTSSYQDGPVKVGAVGDKRWDQHAGVVSGTYDGSYHGASSYTPVKPAPPVVPVPPPAEVPNKATVEEKDPTKEEAKAEAAKAADTAAEAAAPKKEEAPAKAAEEKGETKAEAAAAAEASPAPTPKE